MLFDTAAWYDYHVYFCNPFDREAISMKKQRNVILSLLLCVVLVASTLLPAYAAPGTVKKLQVSAVTANAIT